MASGPNSGSKRRPTDKEIQITAELPGLNEKEVNVELSNNVLTIEGEKKSETEDRDRRFSERYYGRFERRISLDWNVEEDKVAATFRNGVLTVAVPKSADAPERTKRIPISVDRRLRRAYRPGSDPARGVLGIQRPR